MSIGDFHRAARAPRLLAAASALIAAGVIGLVSTAVDAASFITIGTGGVTGVYYPTGGAICRVLNRTRKEHGIRCTAQSTGGSVYNLNTIRAGEIDVGIAQSDWQYHAYNGTGRFKDQGPNKNLRSVFSVHAEPVTIVARADAGIRTLGDLKGRRVNIGNPGSGIRVTWDKMEATLGWRRSDLKLAAELKSAELSKALCDDKIDAFVTIVGHPSGSMQETMSSCVAVLVQVGGAAVDNLVKEFPYYGYAEIPGGFYPNNPTDVKTFGVGATVVTSVQVPERTIYFLVKSVFDNFRSFRKLHPAYRNLSEVEMTRRFLTAPLHDGARKYFKERGWQ